MPKEDTKLLTPGRSSLQLTHDYFNEYKSNSLSPKLKLGVIIIFTITLAGMGSFVFLESISFPCDQYLLAQLYTVFYALLYTITYFALMGRKSIPYVKKHIHSQNVSAIGLFWATNYMFFMISASHISNSMQILMTQMQLILVVIADYYFVGINLSKYKIICICVNISGNMMAIGAVGLTVGVGDIFWIFIFFVSAIAFGVANIYSEIYMNVLVGSNSSLIKKLRAVVVINMLSNLIGIFVTFLAIPLAKYSIGIDSTLYNFSIFTDSRIWYWVGLIFTSYIYSLCSYLLLYSESSIYVTMSTSIGLFVQLCVFMTPLTQYQNVPHGTIITAAIVVMLSSVAYVIKPELRNDNLRRNPEYNLVSPGYSYCSLVLSLMYVVFVGIYFLVDTIIPLMPPLHDCYDNIISHGQ